MGKQERNKCLCPGGNESGMVHETTENGGAARTC